MNSRLPAVLRQALLIDHAQEARLSEVIDDSEQSALEAILKLNWFKPHELTAHLSRLFDLPVIDFTNYDYQSVCRQIGLKDLVIRHNAIPIRQSDNQLLIAVSDPTNLAVEADFGFATGKQIEVVLAEAKTLQGVIRRLYGSAITLDDSTSPIEVKANELSKLIDLTEDEIDTGDDLSGDDSPVSRYVHQVLLNAVRKGASDIHFEPYESSYRIRFRCDGLLVETDQPSHTLSRRLSARLKILAQLDIAERRLPQDGRMKLQLSSETSINIRISTLPTLWGEKIVLRLLDNGHTQLGIESLGYNTNQLTLFRNALAKPQGMILVTGPTGSGKTISLYAGLKQLNTSQINISTAEDPIEINLTGINQVQINPKIGLDFAQTLRAFLRQDPDVVMVGEIRDLETAEIAVKAAQTGHLVLSTLHTNSAAESIVRLQQMGISPFNISSSLSLIIAQRLARKLCQQCKQEHTLEPSIYQHLAVVEGTMVYQANEQGCNDCNNGYSGRIGICEAMNFTPEITGVINQQSDAFTIEQTAKKLGMQTLKQSGVEALLAGITSYAELQRVLFL